MKIFDLKSPGKSQCILFHSEGINRNSALWNSVVTVHLIYFLFFSVSEGKYCSDLQLDPVCDTENHQHPNLCSLQFNRKRLAYKGFCKVGVLQSPFTFYTCVWLLIWRTLGGQQRNVWRKALSLPIASVSDPLVLIVKRLRMFFRMNASRRYLPCVEWMARHTTAHALHTPQELLWIIKACARP